MAIHAQLMDTRLIVIMLAVCGLRVTAFPAK